MGLISAVKRQLHRDIVADPILHARVLNLYLCGEAYPHAVDDYFPVAHVEPELASRMRAHMRDEDKHIVLYTRAIAALGAEVVELPDWCIFNHVIRTHSTERWQVHEGLDADARNDRVANFFAHAHWLEKRIARSLEWHHEACANAAEPFAGKAVAAVLADETRHVVYTREAIFDLVPRRRALAIIASHRRAEHRANLDFSASQLRRLLVEERPRWPASRRRLYGACSFIMRGVLACA
jgi:hypothetical protein